MRLILRLFFKLMHHHPLSERKQQKYNNNHICIDRKYHFQHNSILFLIKILLITGMEQIDMVRMSNILERNILEYMSNLESNPHDAVAFLAIGDVLYGRTPKDVCARLIF